MTFKDGKPLGPQTMTLSIDKLSGKLLGMPFCEMTGKQAVFAGMSSDMADLGRLVGAWRCIRSKGDGMQASSLGPRIAPGAVLILLIGMTGIGAAIAAPPKDFRCPVAPTAEAIHLAWERAPRDRDGTPAWTFRLWISGSGVVEKSLDASSYVLTPAHFRGGKIPVAAPNLQISLQRVGRNGKTQAASHMWVTIPKKGVGKCRVQTP